MTNVAEAPTRVGIRRTLARWYRDLQTIHSPILRYGLSVVCVGIGIGLALAAHRRELHDVELPILVLSIALIAWYAGAGASVLAVVLAAICLDYFWAEPGEDLFSTEGLTNLFTFVTMAIIVSLFSIVRRRVEENLREARDDLRIEVEQRARREDEIRILNQELAKRAAELEATNKELESFAYSVSHDLRAPLRHIVGYGELLQKQASSLLDDKSRRYMEMIRESSKRMGALIDDLLGYSRIGRAETKQSAVDLERLVEEAVAELGQETMGREIAWKIGPLPVCYGDRSMLKVALLNLLSNAVKFTRIRPRAEIEIGCASETEDQAEIFVKDNGAGFDMQYVDKLFGVFQRLHLAEEFEGTGIGLATVQRIVHRHGGEVRAEGAVGQGATFYLSLPTAEHPEKRAGDTL